MAPSTNARASMYGKLWSAVSRVFGSYLGSSHTPHVIKEIFDRILAEVRTRGLLISEIWNEFPDVIGAIEGGAKAAARKRRIATAPALRSAFEQYDGGAAHIAALPPPITMTS